MGKFSEYLTLLVGCVTFAAVLPLIICNCETPNYPSCIKDTEDEPRSRLYLLGGNTSTYRVHTSYTRFADYIEHKTKLEFKDHKQQLHKIKSGLRYKGARFPNSRTMQRSKQNNS
jgi:hypothetical protein